MSFSSPNGSPLASLYKWNDEFSTRRNLCLDQENIPYVESDDALRTEKDITRKFVNGPSDSTCDYKAQKILDFCCDLTIADLQRESRELGQPIALLDESDESSRPRMNEGMLTNYGLYEALKKPVSIFLLRLEFYFGADQPDRDSVGLQKSGVSTYSSIDWSIRRRGVLLDPGSQTH
jgi:hypothetical protein